MLRRRTLGLGTCVLIFGAVGAAGACGSGKEGGFFTTDGGPSQPGTGSDGGNPNNPNENPDGSVASITVDGGQPVVPMPEASVTVSTTIYAHTDDTLYSMDSKTKAPTLLGTFTGTSDASTDSTVTDLAVNAAGDVYVCTESAIYKAALPAVGGVVSLTKVNPIQATAGTRFYALAFTPADALGAGTGEVLIGGDGNGEIWSIDPGTGATKDLGDFGSDPSTAGNFLALSGDLVFYKNITGQTQGLATIRSCAPPSGSGSPTCVKTNDFLASVDMAQLSGAFNAGTKATSLNGGIYGGSATSTGTGIGHGEVFGLGAWEGNVYGFARYQKTGSIAPVLLSIDTTPTGGAGTVLPGTFAFTNGWSGAGVTTTVTIVIPPPPPPPDAGPPPK